MPSRKTQELMREVENLHSRLNTAFQRIELLERKLRELENPVPSLDAPGFYAELSAALKARGLL